MSQEEEYFTVREVAQHFGITEELVRAEIRRKRLFANKIGGEYRISRTDRDAYKKQTHTGNKPGDLALAG